MGVGEHVRVCICVRGVGGRAQQGDSCREKAVLELGGATGASRLKPPRGQEGRRANSLFFFRLLRTKRRW